MTTSQVASAQAAYSRDYFLPEILDELDGYISGDDISRFMRLVASVRRIVTSVGENLRRRLAAWATRESLMSEKSFEFFLSAVQSEILTLYQNTAHSNFEIATRASMHLSR